MTRARQHLIVSGAFDPGEHTTIAEMCRAARDRPRRRRRRRPRRGQPHRPGDAPGGARAAGNGAPKVAAAPADRGPEVGAQLALFTDGGRVAAPLPPLAEIAGGGARAAAAPLLQRTRALSPVRLPLLRPAGAGAARAGHRAGARTRGSGALELGDAVHLELERPDGRWRDLYPSATEADSERIAAFVAAWSDCALRQRVDGLVHARPEVPFAFEVDGVLFRGRFDVFGRRGRRLGARRRLQDQPARRARRAGGHGSDVLRCR